LPTGHAAQTDAAERPLPVEKVPASQSVQTALAVAPRAVEYLPGTQREQFHVSSSHAPAAQVTHAELPAGE